MTPVSSILHSLGIYLRRYLDNWLVQASSQEVVPSSLETVLSLCLELGMVVNPAKSNFVPSQVQYLGTVIDSVSFRASPSQQQVETLLSTGKEFMSSRLQPASSWQVLLGIPSSLSHLVQGGRLHMQSLQLTIHRSWNRVDDSALISWGNHCLHYPSWWLDPVLLQEGVSLAQASPDLDFWSDASDVGWGTHLGREVVSRRWSLEVASLSINAWELLALERGFLHFLSLIAGSAVSVFADNSTAVAYLRKSGGDLFGCSQYHRSEDPSLGGVSSDCSGPTTFWPMLYPGPTKSRAWNGC